MIDIIRSYTVIAITFVYLYIYNLDIDIISKTLLLVVCGETLMRLVRCRYLKVLVELLPVLEVLRYFLELFKS